MFFVQSPDFSGLRLRKAQLGKLHDTVYDTRYYTVLSVSIDKRGRKLQGLKRSKHLFPTLAK